ncbi:MAG: cation transporter dimerization domain-containing protein, partial [Prevotella sp.]|nr:cation transporter dimerization domain-containing protein [Prevotella sp.]
LAVDELYVSEIHNLRTRNVGNHFAMEMHLRLPGEMTLYDAHLHASNIERRLRERFGQDTLITLHLEPLKVNGQYEKPSEESVGELLKE